MHIQEPHTETKLALFHLGFRPFFLSAGLFAVISIALWMAIYIAQVALPLTQISSMQWHAHEMLYGYSVAVIAGFLLTAVRNWTGQQTLQGLPLLALLSLWAMARILLPLGYVAAAGVFDISFMLCLCIAISLPIIKVRQWRQLAVLSKLILLLVCNTAFYLDALNIATSNGIYIGIYGGLYLVIGLILMMARRVLPMFISNGVNQTASYNGAKQTVNLFNSKWLDNSSLVLFLVFFVSELFFQHTLVTAYSATGLFAVNAIRLIGWHCKGIWQKPLLWSLYLSLWSITIGFLLFAGSTLDGSASFIAIHAFAYGGIGTITLAMMARVSLGHTGRNIRQPPQAITFAFGLLLIGGIVRIALPLWLPLHYLLWIGLSQALWITAFGIFSVIYLPILTTPRIDGKPG